MKALVFLIAILFSADFSLTAQSFASVSSDPASYSDIKPEMYHARNSSEIVKATFPGGMEELKSYLKREFTISDFARENGLEGTIVIRCTIGTDGHPVNATVLESVHPVIDAKAKAVVENMPDWSPAMEGGVAKAVAVDIPFQLRLR